MNLFRFRFRYGIKVTDEQLMKLNMLVTPAIDRGHATGEISSWTEYAGDLSQVLTVVEAKDIELVGAELGATALLAIMEKLATIEARSHHAPAFNDRVQVVVPDIGLLAVRSVDVLRDCCTEVLQQKLDEGWHILAVCPQPDQRRPDYVLGQTRKER